MADGHTINLEYVLINVNGEPLKQDGEPVTVRKLIQQCLLNDNPQSPPSPEDKSKSGFIAFKKLLDAAPTFTPEELSLMKKRCGHACNSLSWFQMEAVLDGKADPLCD